MLLIFALDYLLKKSWKLFLFIKFFVLPLRPETRN